MHPVHPSAALKTRSGYQVSIPGGTDEVLIQLGNVEVLRITLGTNMTIKTPGNLTIEANNIELRTANNLSVRASNSVDLKASANLSLNTAGANIKLNGPTVNINNGAFEVT